MAISGHSPFGLSAQVTSFRELLALRIGFAAAQSTQNPICFSLIPELFPKQRTFAMAAYNSAIYMGRALSFAAVIIAGQLGVTHSTSENVGVQLVRPQPWPCCNTKRLSKPALFGGWPSGASPPLPLTLTWQPTRSSCHPTHSVQKLCSCCTQRAGPSRASS